MATGIVYEWPIDRVPVGDIPTRLVADVPPGRRGVFFIEQHAADARLELSWPALDEPAWPIDAPLDYDGVEVVLVPPRVQGPATLRLSAHAPGGGQVPPQLRQGRLRARFELIDERSRPRLEFLGLLTAAGRAWAAGDGDGRRRAVQHYERAAKLGSPETADAVLVTQAAHAAAVLHRLLGEFAAALEATRPLLEAWRAHGDRRREADTWNEIGLDMREIGRLDEAREAFRAGHDVATSIEDPFRLLFLEGNLCLLDLMQRRLEEGWRCYARALDGVRRLGDGETESTYLLNMAQARRMLGELDEAAELYREALAIQRQLGLEKLEAKTLNNLAGLEMRRGELEPALDAYRRAASIFERLGDGPWHGRSLHNLAAALLHLGDVEAAAHRLEEALAIHRRAGYRRGEAKALKVLGHAELARGAHVAALRAYEAAEALEREDGDVVGAQVASISIARVLLATGDAETALGRLDDAICHLADGGKASALAAAHWLRGEALESLGRRDEAETAYREALDRYDRLGHPAGRARVMTALAAFETPEKELELLAAAASILDTVTRELDDADARSLFAGARRAVHERYAARLVAAGRTAEALEVAEAATAWGLRSVLGGVAGLANRAASEVPLGIESIRRLLDEKTLMMHFLVGDEMSHVVVVGRETIDVFTLPPRAELEARVRRVLDDLRDDRPVTQASAELSAALLADAWVALDRPQIERLALVLDGPLHYLPFAALPDPTGWGVLAERFELVRLPSAGVLALERRRRAAREPAPGFAAVLADPVFATADLRFEGRRSAEAGESGAPHRLRSSAREAATLRRAAGDRPLLLATGLEAGREWLLTKPLGDYGLLHLATHARIDDAVASRSGLELAVSAGGRPGFVNLSELRRLDLRAELVVLSACSTALGREIRGEGLVGLVQALLEAGASRVVASLWPVPDRATAELMERFYAALSAGATPAAALRRAQLELRRKPLFEHPSQWAGFVLVGDWAAPE